MKIAVILLVVAILGAGLYYYSVTNQAEATPQTVSGTVTYRERIALAPGSVVEVTLLDTSKQDVAATALGKSTVTITNESVPVPFTIEYDPQQIDERMTYAVRAEILVDGQLAWTSTQSYPVITNGAPTENIPVLVTKTQSAEAASVDNALTASSWVWQQTAMSDGATVTPKKADAFTLTFTTDGMVQVTTDCNNASGQYTYVDGTLTFGQLASTLKACMESQEDVFMAYLTKPVDTMFDADGNLVFKLPVDSGTVQFTKNQ